MGLMWRCGFQPGAFFFTRKKLECNPGRLAMAAGLSGQKIPKEYGQTAPFFRLAALVAAWCGN